MQFIRRVPRQAILAVGALAPLTIVSAVGGLGVGQRRSAATNGGTSTKLTDPGGIAVDTDSGVVVVANDHTNSPPAQVDVCPARSESRSVLSERTHANRREHMRTMSMRRFLAVRVLPVAGALILMSSGIFGLAALASAAAPTFVGNIGTNTRNGSGNSSTIITVGASGVTAGNSILVAFGSSTFGGAVGCSDSKGNSYHVDADRIGGAGRATICSAHNVTALVAGDQITVSYPGFSGFSSVTANEFAGLAHSLTLDQISTAIGNSAAPNSGATPPTTQSEELLYGAFVYSGTNGATFTPGAGFTLTNPDLTGRRLASEFAAVSATGSYSANGTLTSENQWAAVIATYHTASTNCGCFEDVQRTDATHVKVQNGLRLDLADAFFLATTCSLTGCPNGTTCFQVPANVTSASDATLDISAVAAGTYHVIGVWNTGHYCNYELITIP